MHFDGDFYAMVRRESGMFGPIRRRDLIPLPAQNVEILGRPRAGDPVRKLRFGSIARTSAEIDYYGHTELLRQKNSLAARVAILPLAIYIGVERVAVAA